MRKPLLRLSQLSQVLGTLEKNSPNCASQHMSSITISSNYLTQQLKILPEKITIKNKELSFHSYLCLVFIFYISLASECINNFTTVEDSQSFRPIQYSAKIDKLKSHIFC